MVKHWCLCCQIELAILVCRVRKLCPLYAPHTRNNTANFNFGSSVTVCPAASPPAMVVAATAVLITERLHRAAELLTAAAAHRTYVEHCLALGGEPHLEVELEEMVEQQMSREDAIEVVLWHIQPGTCDLSHEDKDSSSTT